MVSPATIEQRAGVSGCFLPIAVVWVMECLLPVAELKLDISHRYWCVTRHNSNFNRRMISEETAYLCGKQGERASDF